MTTSTRAETAVPLLSHVLDEIGAEIVTGVIKTDQRFTLQDISVRFGISRTVAREAMRALEQMGMVMSSRRVGLTVLPMSEWNVFDQQVINWRLAGEKSRGPQLHSLNQVRLAIEPLNRFETDLVNTVERGLELCAATGRDNVGLLLDTFHMNIEEKDLADAVRLAGDRVFHVQVAENDRGTPGSGHVPWAEFFRALDDIGYLGPLTVESFTGDNDTIAVAASIWRPLAETQDALARSSAEFLTALQSARAGANKHDHSSSTAEEQP